MRRLNQVFLCVLIIVLVFSGCQGAAEKNDGTKPNAETATATPKAETATATPKAETATAGQKTITENKSEGQTIEEKSVPVDEKVWENAAYRSGDVFREYTWSGPYAHDNSFQRVNDPEVTNEEALNTGYLPNSIDKITIDDLQHAIKAEMIIDIWSGHYGTTDKKVKINGNEWINIPVPESIPQPQDQYLSYTYPVIPIPLEQLKEGENTFELTCKGSWWGQFIFSGVVFRIYYDPEKKEHNTGNMVLPKDSSENDNKVPLSVKLGEGKRKIVNVDYIGYYEDFDYDGDGIYQEWHYNYISSKLNYNIGSVQKAPYTVEWDTEWIPDQEQPVAVLARITDDTGIIYVTPAIAGIEMDRQNFSVKMYKNYDVPQRFGVSKNRKKYSMFKVTDDLGLITDARMVLATWNGNKKGNEIGVNGNNVLGILGKDHFIGYDSIPVPVEYLKSGDNYFYTFATTQTHEFEVHWPGISLKVKIRKDKQ